jgi:DNA-directed RNA polymerase specialized sigma24 family protein
LPSDYSLDSPPDWWVASYRSLRAFAAIVAPADMEPDDLLHEALERVLRASRARDIENLEGYVRRTIIVRAIDFRRRRARWRRVTAALIPRDDRTVDVYPSDLQTLMTLDPSVRGLLYLVEVEGWLISDAAELVGCSAQAARQRLSRARRQLGLELQGW